MSTAYVGEIRMFGGNFAPQGWLFCDGSLLSIAQNDALFNLIGTTYGGDGVNTFALPDLRGRAPIHIGNGDVEGQRLGTESVSLAISQIPVHTHGVQASRATGTAASPSNNVLAAGPPGGLQVYTDDNTVLSTPTNVALTGGSQPHENRQPLLTVSFIIALYGVYPSQS